jgi:hypothetical protein
VQLPRCAFHLLVAGSRSREADGMNQPVCQPLDRYNSRAALRDIGSRWAQVSGAAGGSVGAMGACVGFRTWRGWLYAVLTNPIVLY